MYRLLGLGVSLFLLGTPALAQETFIPDLQDLSEDECKVILTELDGLVDAHNPESGPSLAGQIRQSVEFYCRAARFDDELVALGVDPDQPADRPVRSIIAGSTDEARARDILNDRDAAREGGQIYLELAVAADPDAANDLLRRLLGKDPGGNQ